MKNLGLNNVCQGAFGSPRLGVRKGSGYGPLEDYPMSPNDLNPTNDFYRPKALEGKLLQKQQYSTYTLTGYDFGFLEKPHTKKPKTL